MVSVLCALYGISRKSGYKWIGRHLRQGPDWVLDRSHSARGVADKTPRVRLGILPEFSEPGKPPQNGRHERMHTTLKAEATKPSGANAAA